MGAEKESGRERGGRDGQGEEERVGERKRKGKEERESERLHRFCMFAFCVLAQPFCVLPHCFCVFPTVTVFPMGGKGGCSGKGKDKAPRWASAVPGESPRIMWSPWDVPEGSGAMPEQEAVQLFPKTSGSAFYEGMEDSAQYRGQLLEEEFPRCVRGGVGRLFIGDCLSALHWAGNWAAFIVNCYNEDSPKTTPPNPT